MLGIQRRALRCKVFRLTPKDTNWLPLLSRTAIHPPWATWDAEKPSVLVTLAGHGGVGSRTPQILVLRFLIQSGVYSLM